ncbi:MAG: outer membrane lipoprotein chaperone LolA [Gammaproteobacteria bacterium]|nr:outer membrane lipoprotein chaperone LolA [Gammaproteobacteria bacterium]
MKKILIAVVSSWIIAMPVWAGEGIDSLNRFFTEAKTLRADIIQYRTDGDGRVVQESKGILLIKKPGKVRLAYKTPYEQLYVADGEKIWSYDPDLEQAIVKKMTAAIGDTPIMLLSSQRQLDNSFIIKEINAGKTKQDLYWVELTPKKSESAFNKVRIAFTKKARKLRIMELEDALGFSTFIEFHNIETNITHAFNAFNFIPPDGVDVISD